MLTERKKADRLKMATDLEKLISKCGATFTREDGKPGSFWPGPREILFKISAAQGLELHLDLDGDSPQPDVHVLSWCVHHSSDAKLSDKFGKFGPLNNYHYRKATYIAEGFDALCLALEYGLESARDGSAFQERVLP